MTKKARVTSIVAFLMLLVASVTYLGSAPALKVANASKEDFYTGKVPKYVFMFIGDGMSYPQVSSAEMYLGNKVKPGEVTPQQLNFTQFPTHGAATTYDSTSFIPDSASTATSIASGHKTLSGVINMDETKTKTYKPITEDLKARGYKIGIITSVPITHATPAAFYAKVASRNSAYEIGKQLASSGFDYFGGGTFDQPIGPNKNETHIFDIVKGAGYKIANTREDILALNNSSGKVVAINPILDGTAMNYELDRDKEAGELSLADFVKEGIEVLDNPNGFFMMVEGGKIDWANHANDAAASIQDTVAFADAVQEAYNFYLKYPKDTLIIVTGDHECGGMSIGFAGTGYSTFFEKIEPVTMSYVEFTKVVEAYKKTVTPENAKIEDLMDEIKAAYGLINEYEPDTTDKNVVMDDMELTNYEMELLHAALDRSITPKSKRAYNAQEKVLYGSYEPLTVTLSHIVNNKAGLNFSSYSHTGIPVPVYTIGAGAELFDGFYDNTDIYNKLVEITKLNRAEKAVGF